MFRRLSHSTDASWTAASRMHGLPFGVGASAVSPREGRAPEDLTPRQRISVVIATLMLHVAVAAGWMLMPVRAPLSAAPMATLRVEWLVAPTPVIDPATPPMPIPAEPRRAESRPRLRPVQQAPLLAAPEAAATPAEWVPTPVIATSSEPVAALSAIAAAPAPIAPASAAVVATAAPAKTLPAEAVRYLVPPAPVYPKLSRRQGESGRVLVRVYIDEAGLPRSVQVSESSGHARLDDAAQAAVQQARFKPYSENGRPTAGWAFIPLSFDLEPRP